MTRIPDAIGKRLPRRDAADKLAGVARYTDDLARPGMLHAAILGSPYPSAHILGIDTAAARALPGVKAVLTSADLPARRWGLFVYDETPLAADVVRYVGEPVAAVAATDLATARAAAALIEVDYRGADAGSEHRGGPEGRGDSGASGFRQLRETPGPGGRARQRNRRQEFSEGDVEAAWADCDVVLEGVYEVPSQSHVYLEPVSAIAEFDRAGKLTVWCASQSVYKVQATLSRALDLPMSNIRVATPAIGGAFGGKSGVTVQPLVAHLARATGRPVRLTLSREEDFMTMRRRHPAIIRVRTGAKADGTLVARDLEIVYDGGAYAEDSPAVLAFGLLMARGPYNIPHCRLRGRAVYTNRLRAAGFRGYGNPQVTFATESQIDELADRLGLDSVEFRLKNAVETGGRWIGGQTITSCGLAECLTKARDAAGWTGRRRDTGAEANGKRRGIGVSAFAHICGLLGTSATVRLLEDGTVTLATGAVDLGQGVEAVLAQICAGALDIDIGRINSAPVDSDAAPYNWSTGGSRVTYMVGRAVVQAADAVREQIVRQAADLFECAPADIEIRPGGRAGIVGVPEKEVSFGDISLRAHYQTGGPIIGSGALVYDGETFDYKEAVIRNYPFARIGTYVFGAHIVEVEVDTVTGKVEILRAWAAHDVGRAINPTAVEGQIQGGFVQGAGYALLEELLWEDGQPVNPSMMDYKVFGALDLPLEIHPIIVEAPEPSGPFGAKGIGEPPLVGAAPAIANAVADATGLRLRTIPMTPERVLDALAFAAE